MLETSSYPTAGPCPVPQNDESEWREMERLLNLNRQQIWGQEYWTRTLQSSLLGHASKRARSRQDIDTVTPLLLFFAQFGGFGGQE